LFFYLYIIIGVIVYILGKTTDLNTTEIAGSTDIKTKHSAPTSLSQEALKQASGATQKEEKATLTAKEKDVKTLPTPLTASENSNSSGGDNSKSPTDLLVQAVVGAGVERTPGDGMDNKINKDLFHSTPNIVNNTTTPATAKQVVVQPTKEVTGFQQLEKSEVQLITGTKEPAVIGESVTAVQLDNYQDLNTNNSNNKPRPYFESSDVIVESKHLMLTKHVDIDVVKSLPSNLNSVSAASTSYHVQPFQKSSTMAALQNPLQNNPLDVSSSERVLASTPSNEIVEPPGLEAHQNYNEAEKEAPTVEPTSPGVYEPFSRSAWPVGGFSSAPVSGSGGNGVLGGSRFQLLWSEATLDNEKVNFILFLFFLFFAFFPFTGLNFCFYFASRVNPE